MTTKPGDPVWVDLFTSDPEGAVAFYGGLFGWTADRAEEFGGYLTFRKDGKAVAGGMGKTEADADAPDQWTIYLSAADARATAAAAAAHGGTVVVPAIDVGDLGTMVVLGDPGGAGVGVWQAGTFPGIETSAMVEGGRWRDHAGAPSWFELHTTEYEKALAFYRDVFGWADTFEMPGAPDFRYTTIHSTSPMLGGVMDAAVVDPAQRMSGWTVYFGAEDVDATVAKAVDLGGRVLHPAEDSRYGRMAVLADPTGARFCVGGDVPGS